MRHFFLFAVLTVFVSMSCKESSTALPPELVTAQRAFDSAATDETYNNYISKILEHIQNSPKGTDQTAVLLSAAEASQKMSKVDQEIIFLNNLIRNYPKYPERKEKILRMIGLLHGAGRHTVADVMAICFIKAFPSDPAVADLKSKLPKVVEPAEKMIEVARAVFADSIQGFNESSARVFVDACEAFAMALPEDPESPEYLFKAAETSNTLRTYEKSFSLYDWIIDNYPRHDRAPISLFMKGFLFDGTLNDSTNAARYYNEFLEKYPSNQFAKDARILLENLGKTDEEVLQDLMKKNPEKVQ